METLLINREEFDILQDAIKALKDVKGNKLTLLDYRYDETTKDSMWVDIHCDTYSSLYFLGKIVARNILLKNYNIIEK